MNSLIAGLVVVIGALGGFYFGAKYGMGHAPTSSTAAAVVSTAGTGQGAGLATGAGGTAGGALGGAAATGLITAVNGTTITVHDRTTNKDIKVDITSARISKTTQGTISDLTQGATVTIVGQTGADGTVTAQVISIGGAILGGGGGGGRRGGASPSPGG